ncbi:MAG TPA: right-handed parallel beta-helix repeat-containing protein [Thermoanaerobaculia bacterium]
MRKLTLFLVLSLPAAVAFAQQQTIAMHAATDPADGRIDPGLQFRMAFFFNASSGAHDVRFHAELPPRQGDLFVEPGAWTCSVAGTSLDCTIADSGAISPIRIAFLAAETPGRYDYRATLTAREPLEPHAASVSGAVFVYKPLHATDGNALRAAIEQANLSCNGDDVECHILLHDDVHLDAALPPLTARGPVTIDGNLYNVDGRSLTAGSGLELRGEGRVRVRRLALRNFPVDGLVLSNGDRRAPTEITDCTLEENRWRGLSVAAPLTDLVVLRNSIRGNGASGIAYWAARRVTERENRIDANDASGVFVWNVAAFDASDLSVALNGQFGFAIVRGAPQATFGAGTLAHNRGGNIDWGLNGLSPRDVDETDGVPNSPDLVDAHYDAATDTTIFRVRMMTGPTPWGSAFWLHLVTGELEPDGTVVPQRTLYSNLLWERFNRSLETFTVAVKGNFTGQYVSAWGVYTFFGDGLPLATPEMSQALRVN